MARCLRAPAAFAEILGPIYMVLYSAYHFLGYFFTLNIMNSDEKDRDYRCDFTFCVRH